jgi:DNA-binding beta-propeller fold protein YncE
VTDRASHVLRTVTPEGQVATLCGQPGQAGHRDSPTLAGKVGALFSGPATGPALFHSPTHAAFHRWSSSPAPFRPSWEEAVVADSGNHVIRTVRLDGRVATLAGTPGVAGYRDSEFACAAIFNDPQGLAVDPLGRVYVADRGNRVIRVISDGAVTTLAGRAGEAGTADGTGAQARFTDLKGMCLHPRLAALLVLDGHALRWVALPGGQVRTLMGVVDQPGFRDLEEGESTEQPCLNDPAGITCTSAGLAIADHGNHAVRIVSPDLRRLTTVAGDPAQGATRWGLIRDGLAGPLDEAYGTLEGPWTVASCPLGQGRHDSPVFVTSGRCLAEIRHQAGEREPLALRSANPPPEPAVGETCVILFTVETRAGLAVQYTADFLDPDGDRRVRVQGPAAGGETVAVQGRFDQAGAGKVRVRCVTCQGVSAGADLAVRIR